jgi:hypothetical protein
VLPETADRPPGELGSELGHCVRQPQDLRSIDLYTLSLHDASFDGMLTFSCRRAKQNLSKQLSGIKCPKRAIKLPGIQWAWSHFTNQADIGIVEAFYIFLRLSFPPTLFGISSFFSLKQLR